MEEKFPQPGDLVYFHDHFGIVERVITDYANPKWPELVVWVGTLGKEQSLSLGKVLGWWKSEGSGNEAIRTLRAAKAD